MGPADYNSALSLVGSSYRVPQQEQIGDAQARARGVIPQVAGQMDAQERAADQASQDRMWGLVNTAANLYTGGAFGAATGGMSSDGAKGGIMGQDSGGWQPDQNITNSYLKGR